VRRPLPCEAPLGVEGVTQVRSPHLCDAAAHTTTLDNYVAQGPMKLGTILYLSRSSFGLGERTGLLLLLLLLLE
jgi:hypothetical protein